MGQVRENIFLGHNKKPAEIDFPTKFLFDAFEKAGINYCLLRGRDKLLTSVGNVEIDLLIKERHMARVIVLLTALGFGEIPAWGHAPHRFFLSYSKGDGHWIKLDVVTSLRYGSPIRRFEINLTETCLSTTSRDVVRVLSYDTEFMTLFLHCLLDKEEFRDVHRNRLIRLNHLALNNEAIQNKIVAYFERFLQPVFTWPEVSRALASGHWDLLLNKRFSLIKLFFRKARLKSIWRNISARLLIRLRPLFFLLKRHGISVALLAPDGAGKSTLADALVDDKYLKARVIYMGTNVEAATITSPFSGMLLRKIKSVNTSNKRKSPYGILVRGINFINKFVEHWGRCLTARYHLLRGRVVIFDRFIYDSWIQKRQKTPWKRLRRFLFEAACPTPDLVILLDAPGVLLFERKQEHSPEWLEEQRQRYLDLQKTLTNLVVVNATKSAERVHQDVCHLIWQSYLMRVRRNPTRFPTDKKDQRIN